MGQLISVAFMYDVTEWAEQQPLDSDDLRTLLDRCESAYRSEDEQVRNLIYGSLRTVWPSTHPCMTCSARFGSARRKCAANFILDGRGVAGPRTTPADFGCSVVAQQPVDSPDLLRLLALCEPAYIGLAARARNLLYVSFLESLEFDSHVFDLLGPGLRADAADFRTTPNSET